MNRDDALEIGIIIKTRGINGEVILEVKDSSVLNNIEESVHLEIEGLLVPFFITNVTPLSNTRFRVTFDWIETESKALKLVSSKVFIPTKAIELDYSDDISPALLEGFEAIDKIKGNVGKVSQYIEHDKNPLLVILKNKTEILLPFQPELIEEIDPENKIVYINAPEGLIDLYL